MYNLLFFPFVIMINKKAKTKKKPANVYQVILATNCNYVDDKFQWSDCSMRTQWHFFIGRCHALLLLLVMMINRNLGRLYYYYFYFFLFCSALLLFVTYKCVSIYKLKSDTFTNKLRVTQDDFRINLSLFVTLSFSIYLGSNVLCYHLFSWRNVIKSMDVDNDNNDNWRTEKNTVRHKQKEKCVWHKQ